MPHLRLFEDGIVSDGLSLDAHTLPVHKNTPHKHMYFQMLVLHRNRCTYFIYSPPLFVFILLLFVSSWQASQQFRTREYCTIGVRMVLGIKNQYESRLNKRDLMRMV